METHVVLPDVWSRRKRNAERSGEDVWTYDMIPGKLRIQLLRKMSAVLYEAGHDADPDEIFKIVNNFLRDDLGRHTLSDGYEPREEFSDWFEHYADTDSLLDAIEYWHTICIAYCRTRSAPRLAQQLTPAVEVINARFREAGVGYRLVDGRITKIADEFLHQQATLPVLAILGRKGYESAQVELRKAFDDYKTGNYEDCLTDCCKALESVLKVIGKARQWTISNTDSLSRLLDAAFQNGLIASDLQAQFNGLKSSLTATGTIRNKHAAHGAGTSHRQIPEHMAAYQLHLTASAILFLHHSANQVASPP